MPGENRSKRGGADASCFDVIRLVNSQLVSAVSGDLSHNDRLSSPSPTPVSDELLSWQSIPQSSGERRLIVEGEGR